MLKILHHCCPTRVTIACHLYPQCCSVIGYGLPGGGHGLGVGWGCGWWLLQLKQIWGTNSWGLCADSTSLLLSSKESLGDHPCLRRMDPTASPHSLSLTSCCHKALPEDLKNVAHQSESHPTSLIVPCAAEEYRIHGSFVPGCGETVTITGPGTEQMSQRSPSLLANGKEQNLLPLSGCWKWTRLQGSVQYGLLLIVGQQQRHYLDGTSYPGLLCHVMRRKGATHCTWGQRPIIFLSKQWAVQQETSYFLPWGNRLVTLGYCFIIFSVREGRDLWSGKLSKKTECLGDQGWIASHRNYS